MRIAVAYDNGEIGLHFGHAEMFAVYDYEALFLESIARIVEMENILKGKPGDLKALLAAKKMGFADRTVAELWNMDELSVWKLRRENGIVPIAGFEGPADLAADLLVLGRLPIGGGENFSGGGCAGGCSGCSGCGPEGCGPDCNCGC